MEFGSVFCMITNLYSMHLTNARSFYLLHQPLLWHLIKSFWICDMSSWFYTCLNCKDYAALTVKQRGESLHGTFNMLGQSRNALKCFISFICNKLNIINEIVLKTFLYSPSLLNVQCKLSTLCFQPFAISLLRPIASCPLRSLSC